MKTAVKINFFLFLTVLLCFSSCTASGLEDYRIDVGSRPVTYFSPASLENYERSDRGSEDINYIVIHTAQGSMESAVNTFASDSLTRPRSAHYVVGRGGGVVKTVSPEDVAWHAGTSPIGSGGRYESKVLNENSIGIEHGGFVSEKPTWSQYTSSAALVSLLCEIYGIPKNRRHIVGHQEIKSAKGDPGSRWDWDLYMELLKEGTRRIRIKNRTAKLAQQEDFIRTALGAGFLVGGVMLSLIAAG